MKKNPKIYDTVCLNGEPDATVWRVMKIDAPMIGIVDTTLSDDKQCIQWVDRSIVESATRAQMKNAGLIF